MPFSKHIAEHLVVCDKQITSASSKFLEGCRGFNAKQINQDALIDLTVQLGFNNVMDAFHNVHNEEVPRFFSDERKNKGGIILTDNFYRLGEQYQYDNLAAETEARWRLVETAWELNVPKHLIQIDYKEESREFFADNKLRRVPVTAASPSLNGYQKVLACIDCNRGVNGKFAKLPSLPLLERLHARNEYLITSHHPLRETLIVQTGNSTEKRQKFLQDAYNCSITHYGIHQKWQPAQQGIATF